MTLATSRWAVLLTVPVRIPTVTPSLGGCFKSVIGLEVISIFSKSWTSLSSISNKDIWHPAQAANQSVAILILAISRSPPLTTFGLPVGLILRFQESNLPVKARLSGQPLFCLPGYKANLHAHTKARPERRHRRPR